MPENKIRVCEGSSVYCNDRQYMPGDLVPLEGRDLEDAIKNGFVEEVYIDDMGNPNTVIGEPIKNEGIWNRNPANLKDKNLEQLNTMILEIDPNADTYETREAAIARLTSDYAS